MTSRNVLFRTEKIIFFKELTETEVSDFKVEFTDAQGNKMVRDVEVSSMEYALLMQAEDLRDQARKLAKRAAWSMHNALNEELAASGVVV